MDDRNIPDISQGEIKDKFPELGRARDLYVELFKNASPLLNLAYPTNRIQLTQYVLSHLEDEGTVNLSGPNSPFLTFDDVEGETMVNIYTLRSKRGFDLTAFQPDLPPALELRALLDSKSDVFLFPEVTGQIAHVGLFESGSHLNDLHFLINELRDGFDSTEAPLGLQPQGVLSQPGKALGLTGTYTAAWVDESTKLEFVAQVEAPEDFGGRGPIYIAYKKLSPLMDARGKMVPIGKKPTATQSSVMEVLEAEKRRVVSGRFVSGNPGAKK